MLAGVVVPIFGGKRQALKNLDVGVFQFLRPCPHPLLHIEVEESGLEQVLDAQADLGRIEGLGQKVLRPPRQG